MPTVPSQADFEAQMDLEALRTAKEVENDPSRIARARAFAERRRDELAEIAGNLPGRPSRGFNKSVRNSKMRPRDG